jgi:hypothetical protein
MKRLTLIIVGLSSLFWTSCSSKENVDTAVGQQNPGIEISTLIPNSENVRAAGISGQATFQEAYNDIAASLDFSSIGIDKDTLGLYKKKKIYIKYEIAKTTIDPSAFSLVKGMSPDDAQVQFGDWYVAFIGIQDVGFIAEIWYPAQKSKTSGAKPSFFYRRFSKPLLFGELDGKLKVVKNPGALWVYTSQGSQFFLKDTTQVETELTSMTQSEKNILTCSNTSNAKPKNLLPIKLNGKNCELY